MIKPNNFYLLCIAGFLSLTSCKEQSKTSVPSDQAPNLVFILVDDLGWADLPAYGNSFNETPHIDQLRKEGVLFTDAYVASPVCSPSRVAILSGQHPARIGITDWIPGHWRPYEKLQAPINRSQNLSTEYVTYAEVLKEIGYVNGYFGKWHLGKDPDIMPQNQGFDESVVYEGWGHFDLKNKLTPPFEQVPDSVFSADQLTDFTIDFIKKNKDNPFTVTLSHFAVHLPLEAKRQLVKKYDQKEKPEEGINNPIYAAMLESVDQGLGKITKTLEELELEKNTIIVFYSDNGGLQQIFDKRDDIVVTTNAPLRDEKGSLYEGGIRVPLMVKWPGKIKPGSTTETLVTGMDVYATILGMLDASAPENYTQDGVNVMPAVIDTVQTPDYDRMLYWHYPHYHHSVPAGAIRRGNYKLIWFYDTNEVALYNLKKDIGETTNIASEFPEITQALKDELKGWLDAVDADMPTENPDYDPLKANEWGKHPSEL